MANDNYPAKRGTWCATYDDAIELQWDQRQFTRTIPLDPGSNIATIYSAPGFRVAHLVCNALVREQHGYVHLIPDDEPDGRPPPNINSNADTNSLHSANTLPTTNVKSTVIPDDETPPELNTFELPNAANPDLVPDEDILDEEPELPTDEALWAYWHQRLGHPPNLRIRAMARTGRLPRKLLECRIPLCPSCVFGKATRRPWRTKGQQAGLKDDTITSPGDCVSIDQLESPTPGIIGQVKGSLTKRRYQVTTVFVDHHSDITFVFHQLTTSGDETVEAKQAFEKYAASCGVSIRHYHADNGRFAEHKFIDAVQQKGQTISFCGVGAHFQNGIAEKRIRDLQDSARTMIIHANRRWPSAITVNLWPYALTLAADVRNATSNRNDGFTPIGIFTSAKQTPQLKDFHTFGCPVYILDKRMQSASKIKKWEERSRVGIYLGKSRAHSQTVHLVLSLVTGHVSAQFHITCDDRFETVRPHGPLPTSQWQQLAGFTLKDGGTTKNEGAQRIIPSSPQTTTLPTTQPIATPPMDPITQRNEQATTSPTTTNMDAPIPLPQTATNASEGAPQQGVSTTTTSATVTTTPTRRSSRAPKPTQRLRESIEQQDIAFEAQFILNLQDELEIDTIHPIAYAASNDPDTLHLQQALREPDAEEFRKAMTKEIEDHERRGHWVLVLRSDIPKGTRVLAAVWSMRRKRRIDTQEIYKYKGRLTIHGGMQVHGVNYWETYSPVVRWSTIRLILTISIMNDWYTRQLDFVLAYPQAPVECDLYMAVPYGYKVDNPQRYALKLRKNLYGQKQAGRVWNKYLTKILLEAGFVQSQVDECMFYFNDCIILIYVDDTIICGPTQAQVDHIVAVMGTLFDVEDQGDIKDYLGVRLTKLNKGQIMLAQPHLIQSIIKDLGFPPRTNPVATPALINQPLQPDPDGEPFKESWSYRSVIGKLNFLEKSTRPDLAYAVHQCARFTADPRISHGKAVKRIVRYLMGTADKGIIMSPQQHSFKCWADADYAGNWNRNFAMEDIATARSRSGYMITYAACLLIWASKLQTEIALSTTEAEYISLSTALREVISLMELCKELHNKLSNNIKKTPTVHCTAFEDNSGAYELATAPKMRPRTKHINAKYHHFRSHVDRKLIQIQQVKTEDQLADFFTKQCSEELFRKFRKTIMGWDVNIRPSRDNWTRECEENDTSQLYRDKNPQVSNQHSLADTPILPRPFQDRRLTNTLHDNKHLGQYAHVKPRKLTASRTQIRIVENNSNQSSSQS